MFTKIKMWLFSVCRQSAVYPETLRADSLWRYAAVAFFLFSFDKHVAAADFQYVPGKWRNIRRIRSHIILCIHTPTVISRLNGSFWLNIDYCCNERKNNKKGNLRNEICVIRNSRTIFKTPLVNTAERIFDLSAEFTYTNAIRVEWIEWTTPVPNSCST